MIFKLVIPVCEFCGLPRWSGGGLFWNGMLWRRGGKARSAAGWLALFPLMFGTFMRENSFPEIQAIYGGLCNGGVRALQDLSS